MAGSHNVKPTSWVTVALIIIGIAFVVAGAAFWIMRSRNQSDMWYDGSAATESWDDSDSDRFDGRSLRSRVGDYASTAKQVAGDYASTARQAVSAHL